MVDRENLLQRFKTIFSEQNHDMPGVVKMPGKDEILPPYLPYAGNKYQPGEGLLFVSINQNLAGSACARHINDTRRYLATSEDEDEKMLWDRLQMHSIRKKDSFSGLGIKPFDDGHGIIACAVAEYLLDHNKMPECPVWESVAATNFVKFSFEKGNRDISPDKQAWESSYDYFISELECLKPKIILSMGNKTEGHIRWCMKKANISTCKLIKIPHSSPNWLSRRINPKYRELQAKHSDGEFKEMHNQINEAISRYITRFEKNTPSGKPYSDLVSESNWVSIKDKYFLVCLSLIKEGIEKQ